VRVPPFGAPRIRAVKKEQKHYHFDEVGRGLRYFRARFPACDAWQISAEGRKDYVTPEGIRVAPSLPLLRTLV
jgi:hypothetical protein